jgi:hypothetical protein
MYLHRELCAESVKYRSKGVGKGAAHGVLIISGAWGLTAPLVPRAAASRRKKDCISVGQMSRDAAPHDGIYTNHRGLEIEGGSGLTSTPAC